MMAQTVKAKNLDDIHGTPTQDWAKVKQRLDAGFDQAPGAGEGPDRYSTWLVTLNPDGSPHATAVGAVWVDDAFWFQTGDGTRKARNVARDPRCAITLSVKEFDLTVEGTAEKVTDPETVARIAKAWNDGGWPCEPDASGTGITAPFNAAGTGPAPWYVYRITPTSAVSQTTVEPGGLTRWTF
jgi:hypothetical protein